MRHIDKIPDKLMQILLEGYLFVMFTVFPLYVGPQKYAEIPYDKYEIFMKASGILTAGSAVLMIFRIIMYRKENKPPRSVFTMTDICVSVYALAVLLSFVFAADREEALKGAMGWYTGFLTQAMMIVIYFLYSRYYHWNRRVIIYLAAGSFGVILLAVLNRLGIFLIDPENHISTFISTIGNINWLASFLILTVPFMTGLHITGIFQSSYTKIPAVIYLVFGYAALLTNGSNSIYPALLVMTVFMFVFGLSDRKIMMRVLICLFLFAGVCECLNLYRLIEGDKLFFSLIGGWDSIGTVFASYHLGAIMMIISGTVLLYLYRNPERSVVISDKQNCRVLKTLCLTGFVVIITVLLVQVSGIIYIPDTFGHNRGFIWRLSREVYQSLPLYRKWIGIGPDSYGSYTMLDWDFMVKLAEYYPGTWLTNSHSEPFTMLINLGIFGAAAYLSVIFSTIFSVLTGRNETEKYCRIPVILALAAYHVNLLVSFQIVPTLPYLYLILAFARSCVLKNHQTVQESISKRGI